MEVLYIAGQKYPSSPGYDWASSSKKEMPWMGISCISQVQEPWGKLPGKGQVFPEIFFVSSQLLRRSSWCTCEVVKPSTCSSVTGTSFSADGIVTASFIPPYVASGWAPFESAWGLCCSWQFSFFIVFIFLFKGDFTISSTVPRGTKSGTESWTGSSTAGAQSTGGKLQRVVQVTAVDGHGFVEEGEDVVKKVNRTGVGVSYGQT